MRYRKRGRPKLETPKHDRGTQELQRKRAVYETEELLDRYRRLDMISEEQHWCGNHFRWLYTIRYGVPNTRAVDPSDPGSATVAIPPDDPYLVRLNQQYKEAETALSNRQQLTMLLDVIAYQQCCAVVQHSVDMPTTLPMALDILVDLWC